MCIHTDNLYDAVKAFLDGPCQIKCIYCGVSKVNGFIKHGDNCRLEALIEAYQQMDHCECEDLWEFVDYDEID